MIKKSILFLICLFSLNSFAQRASSSPYSFFGLGDEFKSRTVEQTAMGGLGAAYNSIYQLNLSNPASYGSLRYTTYAFGLLQSKLTVKDANESQSSGNTNISYVAIGIPVGTKAGISFGLQPVSNVGYSLFNVQRDANENIEEITLFDGDGNVNRIYGGLGFYINKNITFGAEASFLFGQIENNVTNVRNGIQLGTKDKEELNVRGGMLKVGVQYEKKLKNDKYLNVGIHSKLSNDFNITGREYLYSLTTDFAGSEIPRDTTYNRAANDKLTNPLQTAIGVGYGKLNKWYAGLEHEFKDALSSDGFLDATAERYRYGKSSRWSFGGFYTPDLNSINSYWDRVTYRAGFRFEKTGLLVNGNPNSTQFTSIDDFGITFGLGLPLNKKLSEANIVFEYGKRGTTQNSLIQENYFNIRLSLSFSDTWFIKRRID